MKPSKQFIPKNASVSPIRHSNVKVWGQQKKWSGSGVDRVNTHSKTREFKNFTTDKDKISKIFAPKLTVIDNNISINKIQAINRNDYDWQHYKNPQNSDSSDLRFDNDQIEKPNTNLNPNNKIQNILNAIIPKISIGKYTFGNNKLKSKISHQTANISPNLAKNQDQDYKVYDPQAIFKKLNNTKQEPKVNFFNHIKASSNNAASNWWDSIKFDYYEKEWFRKLNYQFLAFDINKNINRLIMVVCVFSLISFFAYLAFFDQYFTIKKYTVQYANGSYLNNQQTFDLISHFQRNKLYKVFPNNQFWFANSISLTASAKEIFPEINSVNIKNRDWPDRVALQVETNKPILTLLVTENNEQKYWRINDNGKISSQDKAAIWYNLVKVEKPYSLQGDNTERLSLFNHSFENDPSQKQRFKLTKILFDYFKSVNIQIATTTFPSISDSDTIMESVSGTKFIFDSQAFEPSVQIDRLDYFLKSKLDKNDYYELEKKASYSYFDFRIINKVYLCKVTEKCNAKTQEGDITK